MRELWWRCVAGVMWISVFSQPARGGLYDDVAVVVNTNSTSSVAIGEYFQSARSIPAVNMIYVQADTVEEIDSLQFEGLRGQIEAHLTSNNLVNSINYLVTTKGVPLKVNRGNTFSSSSPSSSVESELALILGPHSSFIGRNGRFISPYYNHEASFSRSRYGVYLVTRLDAYTVEQVRALIDRSGPGLSVSGSALFVLDQDPVWDSSLPSLNNNLTVARNTLVGKGKSVLLDTSTVYVTDQEEVIGYMSWGSNDYNASNYTQYAIPHHSWAPGAIAETYVSTSSRSFQDPPYYGQSLVADLIAEGASGAKGYVYEPFSNAMALAFVLFDRYTSGHNLAESYYMASRYLSWMDVVIGDPKTSIDGPPNSLPIQLAYLTASSIITSQSVVLDWGTLSELNNYGFVVQVRDTGAAAFQDIPGSFVPGHGTTLVPQHYSWTHSPVLPGAYMYRLKQIDLDGTIHYTDAVMVSVESPTSVSEESLPHHLELLQNYPNPFNPLTTIRYSVPNAGRVAVRVYSSLGQEVTTLVDREHAAGTYAIEFSSQQLSEGLETASGVYFYSLQTDEQIITKKMLLVK